MKWSTPALAAPSPRGDCESTARAHTSASTAVAMCHTPWNWKMLSSSHTGELVRPSTNARPATAAMATNGRSDHAGRVRMRIRRITNATSADRHQHRDRAVRGVGLDDQHHAHHDEREDRGARRHPTGRCRAVTPQQAEMPTGDEGQRGDERQVVQPSAGTVRGRVEGHAPDPAGRHQRPEHRGRRIEVPGPAAHDDPDAGDDVGEARHRVEGLGDEPRADLLAVAGRDGRQHGRRVRHVHGDAAVCDTARAAASGAVPRRTERRHRATVIHPIGMIAIHVAKRKSMTPAVTWLTYADPA